MYADSIYLAPGLQTLIFRGNTLIFLLEETGKHNSSFLQET